MVSVCPPAVRASSESSSCGSTLDGRQVDNANKDGRLITCVMYLNKQWEEQVRKGDCVREM